MKRNYQGGTRAATGDRMAALRLDRINPGESVLDLGCNAGEFCARLSAGGVRATGVDRNAPKRPGFHQLDLNLGLAACFTAIGIGRFDHVLALSIWKYLETQTLVDIIGYYAGKSATIEFNPKVKLGEEEAREAFQRTGLEIADTWLTTDRFVRKVVRLENRLIDTPVPPHFVENEKTGKALAFAPDRVVTLAEIAAGKANVQPGTVVPMRREELASLRRRRWKPLKSWWTDPWIGRPLEPQEKVVWLQQCCATGWDWRRPAHVSYRTSLQKFKLVNGSHRLDGFSGELVPVLVTLIP